MSSLNWQDKVDLYRALGDNTLSNFIKFAWGVVEPSQPYVHGWHIDAIAEHLEAVTNGQIKRLIVNIPPRHGKSTLISVLWPAWVWTRDPGTKWLFASYAASLSVRDNIKFRDLINSPWYQSLFRDKVKLIKELEEKVLNKQFGYRLATSVTGGSTGEGGDYIVADDPHKIEEAESEISRKGVLDWWDQTINTRRNDPEKTRQVVVMQRVHEDDLSGHLLAKKSGYVHLKLPTRYEPTTYVGPTGWKDPRTVDGELLWPERFTEEVVKGIENDLQGYGFASKYQQRPVPKDGAMFSPAWFRIVDAYPIEVKRVVRYWDKAGTEGGGAFTVGVRMSLGLHGHVYVEDVVRGQLADLEREQLIKTTAQMDRMTRPGTEVWIEQEGGSGGKDAAASTIRNLAGFTVFAERPTGDKVVRASPLAAFSKAGNVILIRGPWNEAYLGELAFFPYGKYKDQVDSSSGAFNKLFRGGTVRNVGDSHYAD